MSLKVKGFELPDKTILDDAYLRVTSVNVSNVDYEYLETIEGSDNLLTRWLTRFETKAICYVYGDEQARSNRVSPVSWFEFTFDFESENIFKSAYLKLKKIYPESEDC